MSLTLLTKNEENNAQTFSCKKCDYSTCKKYDYNRHLLTRKHILLTKNEENFAQDFSCKFCNYVTSIKYNYNRHISSCGQSNEVKNADNEEKNAPTYICSNCSAIYNSKQGLWSHKKKCKIVNNKNEPVQTTELTTMFVTLMKQNNEFKELIMEQNQKIIEKDNELKNVIIELSNKEKVIYNTVNSNINTQTNNFSISLFLNEQCKDALNITDFVNSLNIEFEDLEYVGNNGYVEGITNIFMKGLKDLDIYKRPIHCTDIKRETIYIKDEDVWEKDTKDNSKIKKIIGKIAHKNIMKISPWQHAHPECNILDSNAYNLHMRIMKQSLNGGPVDKSERNDYKIIKNIARTVFVDKTL